MSDITKQPYENCKTWQDKCLYIAIYHHFMCLKHAHWKVSNTASHFKLSIGLISENLRLAKEMDGDKGEKIMNCKTREEGLKLIERRNYHRK